MLVVTLLVAAVAVLAQLPAGAHPGGAPQTLEVTGADLDDGDGRVVRVRWRVGAPDDVTVLAESLGLLPRSRVLLDGAIVPSYGDGTVLAEAPELADYLLARIRVRSGGVRCDGEVEPVDHVGADGVVVDFVCPDAVTAAEVTVRTLMDLSRAYRVLAVGPGEQSAVYAATDDTHRWQLAADGADGGTDAAALTAASAATEPSPGVLLPGLTGAVLLASVASGLVWFRRRGRRPDMVHGAAVSAPPSPSSCAPPCGGATTSPPSEGDNAP